MVVVPFCCCCSGVVAAMSALRTEFCIFHAFSICVFAEFGFRFLATYDDAGIPGCDLCVVISGCFEESSVACLLIEHISYKLNFRTEFRNFRAKRIPNHRTGNEPRSQSLRALKEEEAA